MRIEKMPEQRFFQFYESTQKKTRNTEKSEQPKPKDESYRYENGDYYRPLRPQPVFVPDHGFDGPG